MSIRAFPRTRGIAWLRSTLVVCVILATLIAVAPRDASAQGTGFTGELYYGNTVQPPGGTIISPEYHSYGFHSTENTSLTARGLVWSAIDNTNTNGIDVWAVCNDFCRVCLQGTYPNCTDTDGWPGLTQAGNESSVNLRIRGHGVY